MATWNIGFVVLGVFHFLQVHSILPQTPEGQQGLELREDIGNGHLGLPENFHPHTGSLIYNQGRQFIANNPVGQMILGVSTITHLYGDIIIDGTERLEDLGIFPRLVYVEGSIRITGNRALQRHGGFPKLRRVSGSIVFSDNAVLERITTRASNEARPNPRWALFPALRECGSIEVIRNPLLFQALQMPTLERCTGGIVISENGRVEIISGFQNLFKIAGSLQIRSNNRLKEIDAFVRLKTVDGDFAIDSHSHFNSVATFERLEKIWGDFTVVRNRRFIKANWLEAFSHLTEVGGSLNIEDNGYDDNRFSSNKLSNVNGLRRLRRVGGSLNIQRIEPTQTTGLCGLQSVGGEIYVGLDGWPPRGCNPPWSLNFNTENPHEQWRRLTRRELWDVFQTWLRSNSCERTCDIGEGGQKKSLRVVSSLSNSESGSAKKEAKQCENYHGDKLRCIFHTSQRCKYREGKCFPAEA